MRLVLVGKPWRLGNVDWCQDVDGTVVDMDCQFPYFDGRLGLHYFLKDKLCFNEEIGDVENLERTTPRDEKHSPGNLKL